MVENYGCFAFGWPSCRQTINAITNANKARAAAGRSPAISFIRFSPHFLMFQSFGVIHVPTDARTNITTMVDSSNFQLPCPVTHWPIRAIEIINSADRPTMAATYFLFALLNLTSQEYHTSMGRTI